MNTEYGRNIEKLQGASLNWRRIMTAIARGASKHLDQEQLQSVQTTLMQLIELTGYWSISRKALINIGHSLVQSNIRGDNAGIRIICPVCLDRSGIAHTDGLPTIIQQHVDFLDKVHAIIPVHSVVFLFATYGKKQTESDRHAVLDMIARTRSGLQGSRYSVQEMDRYMPTISVAEEKMKEEMSISSELFRPLVRALTPERQEYCIRRSIDMRFLSRAITKSIAEFMVLGRYAASAGTFICIHTTGRIRCFIKAGAAVLHNPVSLH